MVGNDFYVLENDSSMVECHFCMVGNDYRVVGYDFSTVGSDFLVRVSHFSKSGNEYFNTEYNHNFGLVKKSGTISRKNHRCGLIHSPLYDKKVKKSPFF